MSGFRANCGYGKLIRNNNEKITDLPVVVSGSEPVVRTPVPVWDKTIDTPGYDDGDCIHQLIHRFGVGIDLSINRNRNNNYHQDIGLREITAASSGMYDIDFTINGAFAPECCDWIEYLMMSDPVVISVASTFVQKSPEGTPASSIVGCVKDGGVEQTTPISKADFDYYKGMIDAYPNNEKMKVKVFSYTNLDGPKYFDLGYTQINKNTALGGFNEIGVLTGCVIDSASISYESGSDAAVKFSINGVALKEYVSTTAEDFDYNGILDDIPSDGILVTGCLSVADSEKDTDDDKFESIAQTDSASLTVSNNTTKLGNCLELTYSGFALGALGYELSTSTYSNDPNKYFRYMYGIDGGFEETHSGTTDSSVPENYTIRKKLTPIKRMRIRSAGDKEANGSVERFLDLNMSRVFVGTANRTYSVDSAIMDEPELRPSRVQIAVGCKLE